MHSARATAWRACNIAKNSSSSSLLEIGDLHVASAPESRYVGDESVPIARLDDLRSELVGPDDRVYLKIDTQGYELEVLNGAVETLGQVVAADIELSLAPLYEGAPLVGEVLAFLDARALVPVWLEPAFTDPDTGRLLQVDGLFVLDRVSTLGRP